MKKPGGFWKGLGILMLVIAGFVFLAFLISFFKSMATNEPGAAGLQTSLLVSSLSIAFGGLVSIAIGNLLDDVHASKVFLAKLLCIKLEERGEVTTSDIQEELK